MAAAAATVGQALFGKSKFKKPIAIHELSTQPGYVYQFTEQSRRDETLYYRCHGCHTARHANAGRKVPTVTVKRAQFLSDPENPKSHHFCQLFEKASVIATQMDREVRNDIRDHGRRPLKAYNDVHAKIAKGLSHDPNLRDQVRNAVPPYSQVRSGYYRNLAEKIPHVPSIDHIPDYLKQTFLGRHATNPADQYYNENYLIYQTSNPPCLIFASPLDLAILHDTEIAICDGSFEYFPDDFAQIYTLHGFINGEAVPLVHGLLPGKSEATYDVLFSTIVSALVQNLGSVGKLATGHFRVDFEAAAINSAKRHFPQATVKGCTFHMAQALQRNVNERGLKNVYEQRAPYDGPQFQAFRDWIRKLVALSVLPPDRVMFAWNEFLKIPPFTGDASIDNKIREFAGYFERFWLKSMDQIELFNHFDGAGPRTTNHAEGYHRSFAFKYDSPRMSLGGWLVAFQEVHHGYQVRKEQLMRGQPPKARSPNAIAADQALDQRKQDLLRFLAAPHTIAEARAYISTYLSRCGHLLGTH